MRLVTVIFAILAAAALVALSLVVAIDAPLIGLGWVFTAVAFSTFVIRLIFSRNDRARLWWLRSRYRLRGSPSLPWNLSVELHGDFSDATFFEAVADQAQKLLEHRVRIVAPRAVNGLRLAVDGLGLVEFILDDTDELEVTSLAISFTGLRVAPHEAEQVVRREILPLVRTAENAAGGMLRRQSWALRVHVDAKTNPFLGLYLRDRDPDELQAFHVSLVNDATTPNERVEVDKSFIYLTASTTDGFLELVRDFVTFSGRAVAAPAAHA